jgi:hypothetical protein
MKQDAENGFVQKWDRRLKKSLGGALRQLRPTGGAPMGTLFWDKPKWIANGEIGSLPVTKTGWVDGTNCKIFRNRN